MKNRLGEDEKFVVTVEHGAMRFIQGYIPSSRSDAFVHAGHIALRYQAHRKKRNSGPWPVIRVWQEIHRVETKPIK